MTPPVRLHTTIRLKALLGGAAVLLLIALMVGLKEATSSAAAEEAPVYREPPVARAGSAKVPESLRPPSAAADDDGLIFVAETPTWTPAFSVLSTMLDYAAELDSFAATDYADPGARGVPLVRVEGRADAYLSPHFRVGDIMASDGAPYARISPKLIRTLEHVRWLADAPLFVSSGYRHPALNASPSIGGATRSLHMAGMAADVWSSEKTPGELAEIALTVTECTGGIGLGRTFIHLDVRGHLASWAQSDAAMDEATFDAWVRARCSREAVDDEAITDESASDPLSFAETARRAAERSQRTAAVFEDTLVASYRDVMAVFARARQRAEGQGAVVLDLSRRPASHALNDQLFYVLPGSDEARIWKLDALMRSVQQERYFVYMLIRPDGTMTTGAMSYALALSDEG